MFSLDSLGLASKEVQKMMFKNKLKRIIPRIILPHLIRIKNAYMDLGSHVSLSYSQEGEDMILSRIFGDKPFGFFVDVGAHHPKRFSNTYLFYKRGWRGINIDAMPGSMKSFNRFRPRDINLEQPISNKKQKLIYYGFNEPALNGFSSNLSENRKKMKEYHVIFTRELETITLDSVLELNLPNNINEIDFLTIDVEGLDFEVLRSINLKKYHPKFILIEILGSNSISEISESAIAIYLRNHGYEVYAKTVNTVFFRSLTFNLGVKVT